MPVLFQIHDSDNDQVLKDKLRKIFDHISKRLDSNDKTTEIVERVVTTSESGGGSSSLITHASTHENGGADEIDHDSLEGFVALEHYPAIDEDDMASDRDVHVPTQQSVKAYVDDNIVAPGGSDTEIQFNDGGSFGGDSELAWDKTNDRLSIGSDGVSYVNSPLSIVNFDANIEGGAYGVFIEFDKTDGAKDANDHLYGQMVKTVISSSQAGTHGNFVGQYVFASLGANSDVGDVSNSRHLAGLIVDVVQGSGSTVYNNVYGIFIDLEIEGSVNVKSYGLKLMQSTSLDYDVYIQEESPNLVLHNDTHEDGDGGRESQIDFRGEQSGGEVSTLARIQAQHDESSDDEKGELNFYTNAGSDGDAPTERMRIDSVGDITMENNLTVKQGINIVCHNDNVVCNNNKVVLV